MFTKRNLIALGLLAGAVCSQSISQGAQSPSDFIGVEVRFKSVHGFYLTGASRDGQKAHQNNVRGSKNDWTVWTMHDRGNGQIVLQCKSNGRFLTGMSDGSVEGRGAIGAWEPWQLVANPNGTVSFRNTAFNRYLSGRQEEAPGADGMFNAPVAQVGGNGSWEQWTVEPAFQVIEVTNFAYQLERKEQIAARPKFVGEFTRATNNTAVEQTVQMSFKQVVKIESSFTQTTGIQVGASATVSVGIPEVLGAQATVSAGLTQEWSKGMTQSMEKTVEMTFPVRVAPGHSVGGKVMADEWEMSVPWTATARCRTSSGQIFERPIAGVWKGTSVWNFQAEWR